MTCEFTEDTYGLTYDGTSRSGWYRRLVIHDLFLKQNKNNIMNNGLGNGNQAQKEVETVQNQENRSSVQVEPETAVAENLRDNFILSHESEENLETSSTQNLLVTESVSKSTRPREWRFLKNYPEKFVIGNVSQGVRTRSSTRKANEGSNIALLSQIEPQNLKEAFSDSSWVKAMEDELIEPLTRSQDPTFTPSPSPPTSPPRTAPMARTKTTPQFPAPAKPTPPPKATPFKPSSSKPSSSKGKRPAVEEPIP
nr:mucin-7-like [Arachis hypogaea]